MRSAQLGKSISAVEVTNVSHHGFWLLLEGRELFLAFDQFPWFRDVSIRQLLKVELLNPHHLYWPELDIDLAMESIEHPERYPLVSRQRPNSRIQPTRRQKRRRSTDA
jgi:hypothetical protein